MVRGQGRRRRSAPEEVPPHADLRKPLPLHDGRGADRAYPARPVAAAAIEAVSDRLWRLSLPDGVHPAEPRYWPGLTFYQWAALGLTVGLLVQWWMDRTPSAPQPWPPSGRWLLPAPHVTIREPPRRASLPMSRRYAHGFDLRFRRRPPHGPSALAGPARRVD